MPGTHRLELRCCGGLEQLCRWAPLSVATRLHSCCPMNPAPLFPASFCAGARCRNAMHCNAHKCFAQMRQKAWLAFLGAMQLASWLYPHCRCGALHCLQRPPAGQACVLPPRRLLVLASQSLLQLTTVLPWVCASSGHPGSSSGQLGVSWGATSASGRCIMTAHPGGSGALAATFLVT